jgi:hypothetical protein
MDPLGAVKREIAFYERQVRECTKCIIPCRICPLGLNSTHFSNKLNELRGRLIIYEIWFGERSSIYSGVNLRSKMMRDVSTTIRNYVDTFCPHLCPHVDTLRRRVVCTGFLKSFKEVIKNYRFYLSNLFSSIKFINLR